MENVFKRTEAESSGSIISSNLYNLIIGLVLAWGFFINWVIVKSVPVESLMQINRLFFFIGYIALCFLGIFLYTKSSNPLVSFAGYNLVVIPFGFIINLVVAFYDPAIVISAMRITGLVTIIMMVLGTLFPAFFQKISRALTIALVVVIIVQLIEAFILETSHGFIDWIVVLIFCGYIGVDWGRANRIPKTVDNAVDSAASLYMDIINLFLRIVRILGRSNR